MRGTSNISDNQSRVIFYTIMNGKFVTRVERETKTSVARKLTKGEKTGQQVHEEHYDTICGQLVSVKVKDSAFGKRWLFTLDTTTESEREELSIIETAYSSGYAAQILNPLQNCDLKEDIFLRAYKFTPKGEAKTVQGVNMYQGGTTKPFKIAAFYTKEDPKDLPVWEKVLVKGQEQWDNTKQMQFYEKMVQDLFPEVEGNNGDDAGPNSKLSETDYTDTLSDIPF